KPKIIWYHNGAVIREDNNRKIINEGNKSNLIIEKVNKEDEGEYRARVFSFMGEAISIAKIKIQDEKSKEISLNEEKIIQKKIKLKLKPSGDKQEKEYEIEEEKKPKVIRVKKLNKPKVGG